MSHPLGSGKQAATATTAFDRVLDGLHDAGKTVKNHVSYAQAQCPAHDDRDPSLTIYRKPGRIKIVCYAGCDDALDILPALDLGVRDLFDEPSKNNSVNHELFSDTTVRARIEARRSMTPIQRALDDLLHLPDLGERLCRCIAAQGGDGHE
jgi:hypothetical protein